jgi:Family of unknown function (DUF6502)
MRFERVVPPGYRKISIQWLQLSIHPITLSPALSGTAENNAAANSWLICSISCTDDILQGEMPRTVAPRNLRFNDPLKEATIVALKRVVDPLIDLMFDAGVTVHEFSQLIRERAVRTAAKRVSREIGRHSKSRVAIITGLPRSEVARILRSGDLAPTKRLGQHPSRNVLAAWFENPRFLAANGDPAVLPIFGKRRSFEQLVAMYSRGIPVRAMLDELTQIDAIERLADQRVKAKSRIPILTGLTGRGIAVIGERSRDLLDTLTNNLRRTSKPLFEGTALLEAADPDMVSLVRREIAAQGESFISSANSLLRRCAKPSRSIAKTTAKCRLGVTVYYFQDDIETAMESQTETRFRRRKNLQRQRHSTKGKQTNGVLTRSVAKA